MKVGLSLSRCVRDIVLGKVSVDDVLVIVTRTDFDPNVEEEWEGIWNGYTSQYSRSAPEWIGLNKDDVYAVIMKLWEAGLIHQPRKFGGYPRRLPYYWLETVVVEEDMEQNLAVKSAWEQLKILSSLSGQELNNHTER